MFEALHYRRREESMLVKFEVDQDEDLWCARGIGEDIFTQARSVDELFQNIKEAVQLHFENGAELPSIDILVVSELKLHNAPAASS